MKRAVLLYTTFPDEPVATFIGESLVQGGLAACVNLFLGMKSIYTWEGQVERALETAALFKTHPDRADALIARLKEVHPYKTPILLHWIASGDEDSAAWIERETRSSR